MSSYNQRKEPTFGEPKNTALETENISSEDMVKPSENGVEKQKMSFSLHTKKTPDYTFTPVMTHPKESAQTLSTLEEQAMLNEKNTQAPSATVKPKENGGFAFAPVVENEKSTVETKTTEKEKTEQPQEKPTPSAIERVIPAAAAPVAKAAVEKVPSKYRRLLIVLLLLLALLLTFFLLKPKAPESVENLQQQGSSLPIEFRPVNEEEAKRAEEQAKALQEAQAQQKLQEEQAKLAQEQQTAHSVQTETPAQPEPQPEVVVQQPREESTVVAVKPVEQTIVEHKPVVQEPAKKPSSNGSVIYQPETTKATKAPQSAQVQQPKHEVVKPQAQAKTETVKATAQSKPVTAVKAEPPKMANAQATFASSKTLIVPKGVSLMQVFRDNNLNISDVNAMSKVNNIVSNLKVGEKIIVRLDKDNRVVEMIIASGGRFVRQPNGSYVYYK